MKLLFLISFIFLTGSASAQQWLKSSDPGIDYDSIQPDHFISKIVQYDTLGNIQKESASETEIKVNRKTQQISFIRFSESLSGRTYRDTSVIGPLPISLHSIDGPVKYELKVNFKPTQVLVNSLINGEHKSEIFPLNEGYFDDNVLEDMSGYLPLKKFIVYKIECYRFESTATKGVNTFQIQYLFDDFLPGSAGAQIECKVLHFINGYSNGYIWISKTSRAVVKEVLNYKNSTRLIIRT